MNKSIEGFENILTSLDELDNRNEGTISLLEKMLNNDPARIQKVICAFDGTSDDGTKEILAGLIVKFSNEKRYKDYLISCHDWDESDFECT